MPQPTVSDIHIDRPLTNVSLAYIQSATDFIATQFAPIIPVDRKTDTYFTYTKNDWFRDEAKPRADGTQSAGSGYGLSTAQYSCDVFAIHKDIGPQAMANADPGINLEREAAMLVTQRMLIRQERQWATDCFGAGIWSTDVTPSNLWSDYANSDPINDVETGKRTVLANTGFLPNTLVLGYDVFIKLKNHPDIIDRIKYTSAETVTLDVLARYFDIDRVLVAKAVYATNIEGETAAYSFVHGKHALLAHVAPNPGLLTPSAAYTFVWRGVSMGLGANVAITREVLPGTRGAVRIEAEAAWDNKIVAPDLGYFFNAVVA
jgi:hypothetical protein